MFDKLEDLLIRFEELLSELQEPDVANDQNRFRRLMKEQILLLFVVQQVSLQHLVWKSTEM